MVECLDWEAIKSAFSFFIHLYYQTQNLSFPFKIMLFCMKMPEKYHIFKARRTTFWIHTPKIFRFSRFDLVIWLISTQPLFNGDLFRMWLQGESLEFLHSQKGKELLWIGKVFQIQLLLWTDRKECLERKVHERYLSTATNQRWWSFSFYL